MITISSLIFLIWSLLNSLIYIRLFNKSFGLMLPISFISQALLCLLSGIFLKDALFIPLILSIIGILFSIYKLIKEYINSKDIFNKNIKLFINNTLIIYILMFIFVVVIERNRTITRTDDLMHWGLFVMDILETHELPLFLNNGGYTWFHADYPQFFSVFEAFFNYICMQGYIEWYSISSIVLFCLSLFLPIFDNAKSIIKNILLLIAIILIGFCISDVSLNQRMAMFYDGLSVDYVLGILIAFGLYLVYKLKFDNWIDNILLVLVLLAIVNTKQMAICFYLLIVFALLLKNIIHKEKFNYKYLIYLLPLLSFVHWNYLVSALGQEGQFQLDNLDLNLIGIYNGTSGEVWQTNIINYYIDTILYRDLHHFIIPMPYFVIVGILIIINIILAKINKNKYILETNIVLIIGAIGYAFALLLTYVYLFGEGEGSVLAAFERYIQTYTLAMISFIVLMYSEYMYHKNVKSIVIMIAMMIFMVDITSFKQLKQNDNFLHDELALELLSYQEAMNNDEKILVINQFIDEYSVMYERNVGLRYYMAKDYHRNAMDNIKFINIYESGNWNEQFVESITIKNIDEFKEYIKDFNFIYHYKLNDYYIDLFNQTNDQGVLNDRLYRIKDNKLILIDHINTIENTR